MERDEHDKADIARLIQYLTTNEDGVLDSFDNFREWCKSMAEIAFDKDMNGKDLPKGVHTLVERTDTQ